MLDALTFADVQTKRYEIVPCRLSHIRRLAVTMRADDRAEIEGDGLNVRHTLQRLWRRTADPKVALVDGEVAAAWGDEAGLLADVGRMWFFTAPPIERVPLAFFREARRDIVQRLQYRNALIADVAASYERATRFFSMVGFHVGEPRPAHTGALYRQMRIKNGL